MGRQWFSLRDRRPEAMLLGVQAAAASLDGFLDDELERQGLPPQRLALVGFSQGTMMALHVALRRLHAPAAVLGFSGALIGAKRLAAEIQSRPQVFLIHGADDDVVSVQSLPAAVAGLQSAGVAVQWEVRPGLPHAIDPEGIEHGAAFLAAAFRDTATADQHSR
jgi:phospholipase/carboxylesterase